jgi:H+/gluconate symporter-like permease
MENFMEGLFIKSIPLSVAGIILAFVLVMWLIMKGYNILVVAFFCSAIITVTGGIDWYVAFKTHYMAGFVSFMQANYLIFLTGTLMGKMMEVTKGAKSVSKQLIQWFGKDKAIISVPLACGILGYGGVSAFVISFCVFPIALQIFKEADYPRRFIPAALTFGCSTFAMIAPGALQIHNAVPAGILNTPLYAGAVVGFISCGVMLTIGCIWLTKLVRDAMANGERFVAKPMDVFTAAGEVLPNFWIAMIPLVLTLVMVNWPAGWHPDGRPIPIVNLESGLLIGSTIGFLLMYGYQDANLKAFSPFITNLTDVFQKSMGAIINTCAVVGFGRVASQAYAWNTIMDWVKTIPGPELVGASLAMYVIAGIMGSASGALALGTGFIRDAWPNIPAAHLHRSLALASATLDSLPHNGYIITVTNGVCNETHKDAYGAVFKITVIPPIIGSIVCVILFTLFPNLP